MVLKTRILDGTPVYENENKNGFCVADPLFDAYVEPEHKQVKSFQKTGVLYLSLCRGLYLAVKKTTNRGH